MAEDFKPWDVKVVRISLGGEDDADGWLEAEVFDDKELRISFNGANIGDCQIGVTSATVEEMSIDVARRLRDFLTYAVPNAEVTGA